MRIPHTGSRTCGADALACPCALKCDCPSWRVDCEAPGLEDGARGEEDMRLLCQRSIVRDHLRRSSAPNITAASARPRPDGSERPRGQEHMPADLSKQVGGS